MKDTETDPENCICTLDPFPMSVWWWLKRSYVVPETCLKIFDTSLTPNEQRCRYIRERLISTHLLMSWSTHLLTHGQGGRVHRNLAPILPYQTSLIKQWYFPTSLCWNLLYHCQDSKETFMGRFFHCHTLSSQQLSLGSCKFLCPLASSNWCISTGSSL